jgi:hypothetical protein
MRMHATGKKKRRRCLFLCSLLEVTYPELCAQRTDEGDGIFFLGDESRKDVEGPSEGPLFLYAIVYFL